ncbi:SPI-2 type III secretion system translocon protein SseD [Salmonella enterica]|uniref:SPI-2 type III secretion system translocon protein SseD n=1 Tax=Salmonella enterica TaxID=28901 RepID=A0A633Q355_SALER|nr:SPI-2 type III secretion system translocon protein SseD [Salmonella enterica subsp. arizonae serovar 63:z4,z32:-]EAY4648091.1 SPI-2 type III secretion system translocon protein SseD [Salmonella enterica]HAB1627365.1 SPI-2 type III secretion system translocon protein SseD [Salmonella enterica subsp. arizonae]ECC4040718.1 SPI-2 type III secretion system translocon protein SseD [Salmonella enterica]ECG9613943.1 SPI-2 type III secretion system translocon protein SseD [Salmonella enterica]
MEASNVIPVLTTSPLLGPSSTPSPSGEKVDAESWLWLFDDIWRKLIELAKKLRNIMRAYNEVKQQLSWELAVNAFNTQMKTIDQTYKASTLNGVGSILSGMLTIGFGVTGGEAGVMFGQGAGHIAAGGFSLGGSAAQRQSDQTSAIAELQQKGAQSYNKTLTEIMDKAADIMQKIMSMGASLVEVLAQILQSLTR